MTKEERELALYCLKASSDYHSEVCEECINYSNCDHTIQDDVTETIIKALEQEPCEDAINREDAINKIEEWADGFEDGEYFSGKSVADAIRACGGIVAELPSVTPSYNSVKTELEQTRWIPVSERLPKAGEYVGDVDKYYLVQNEYGDMLVARYTHSEYWEQIFRFQPISDEIVAWMPLPKPYRAESEEEE